MEPITFSLFRSLPPEIRQEIYLLATPPRVVSLNEQTKISYKEFRNQLRTQTLRPEIHPDIEFFRVNWAAIIQTRVQNLANPPRLFSTPGHSFRPETLEFFGIVEGGHLQQPPRTPSKIGPGRSCHWMMDVPDIAWEFAREGYLYSQAPIPPLLHTCSDSRASLMRRGYELAFSTRSAGPRTWFNFHRDTLYLQYSLSYRLATSSLLSPCPWDVGQFAPADLQRIRSLALERTTDSEETSWLDPYPLNIEVEFSSILRLLGNVEELLLAEWTVDDIELSTMTKKTTPERELVDMAYTSGDFIVVQAEIADAALCLFGPENWRYGVIWSGPGGRHFKEFIEAGGSSEEYPEHQRRIQREWLKKQRDELIARDGVGNCKAWKIPNTTTVHVLPRALSEFLQKERESTVKELSDLKTMWASLKRSTHGSQHTPESRSHSGDLKEKFENDHWPEEKCGSNCLGCYDNDDQEFCLDIRGRSNVKKWWIQQGPLLGPSALRHVFE
ncbi:hypothetical protein EsH8_V_000942 [Colletotrichum jinshuiense]